MENRNKEKLEKMIGNLQTLQEHLSIMRVQCDDLLAENKALKNIIISLVNNGADLVDDSQDKKTLAD